MRTFTLRADGKVTSILCLGAHSDDIEIGVGGTILEWLASGSRIDVHWCVLTAAGPRAREAMDAAHSILRGANSVKIHLPEFRDGFLPSQFVETKQWFEQLKSDINPDLIFTHRGDDAHQDHRQVQQLTWNSFRDHLILEYEIPKWDGDLSQSNTYVPLHENILEKKLELLNTHFASQRSKDWFDEGTFRALARIRGMECRSGSRYAEAFLSRKTLLHL
jgi:LmbE family N-acetylglucosaminyl deacetylase